MAWEKGRQLLLTLIMILSAFERGHFRWVSWTSKWGSQYRSSLNSPAVARITSQVKAKRHGTNWYPMMIISSSESMLILLVQALDLSGPESSLLLSTPVDLMPAQRKRLLRRIVFKFGLAKCHKGTYGSSQELTTHGCTTSIQREAYLCNICSSQLNNLIALLTNLLTLAKVKKLAVKITITTDLGRVSLGAHHRGFTVVKESLVWGWVMKAGGVQMDRVGASTPRELNQARKAGHPDLSHQ